jgi:prevent-host-death family protein
MSVRADVDTKYDQSYILDMKKVAAAKFKEQCLSLLDHLDADGIVVTKHGKPVARVLPIETASAELIGSLRGKIRVKGDLLSTGVRWNAGD